MTPIDIVKRKLTMLTLETSRVKNYKVAMNRVYCLVFFAFL